MLDTATDHGRFRGSIRNAIPNAPDKGLKPAPRPSEIRRQNREVIRRLLEEPTRLGDLRAIWGCDLEEAVARLTRFIALGVVITRINGYSLTSINFARSQDTYAITSGRRKAELYAFPD